MESDEEGFGQQAEYDSEEDISDDDQAPP